MTQDDDRPGSGGGHDDLGPILSRWQAPRVPKTLDARVLASYRREHVRAQPFWQRFFSTSIRVPLPVAVAVLVLLLASVTLAVRRPAPVQEAGTTAEEVQTARGGEAPVLTHTSLAGFEPATGGDATLVLESGP